MINHARSLLLNLSSYGPPVLPPGEEFIPYDFTPIVLPQGMRELHQVIIPSSASRERKNQLVFLYMQGLHSPDFLEFTAALDSRFTYQLDLTHFLQQASQNDLPPTYNFELVYNQVVGKELRYGIGSRGLFTGFAPYEDLLTRLNSIYRGADSNKDRLLAAVLGVIYQIEYVRQSQRLDNA